MIERETLFLDKAGESLAGAESEYVNRRYNNCANRSYYACFQAAVHALAAAGIRSSGALPTWSHDSPGEFCWGADSTAQEIFIPAP